MPAAGTGRTPAEGIRRGTQRAAYLQPRGRHGITLSMRRRTPIMERGWPNDVASSAIGSALLLPGAWRRCMASPALVVAADRDEVITPQIAPFDFPVRRHLWRVYESKSNAASGLYETKNSRVSREQPSSSSSNRSFRSRLSSAIHGRGSGQRRTGALFQLFGVPRRRSRSGPPLGYRGAARPRVLRRCCSGRAATRPLLLRDGFWKFYPGRRQDRASESFRNFEGAPYNNEPG